MIFLVLTNIMGKYKLRSDGDPGPVPVKLNHDAEVALGMSNFERELKRRKVRDTTAPGAEDGNTCPGVEDDNISPSVENGNTCTSVEDGNTCTSVEDGNTCTSVEDGDTCTSVEDGNTCHGVEDDSIGPNAGAVDIGPNVEDVDPGFSGDPVSSLENGASSLSSEAGGSLEVDDDDNYDERAARGGFFETMDRLFDQCDGMNFKNGWTFDFIKSAFSTVPNVHFFEQVLCAILGIKLAQSLTLKNFVKFLLLQSSSSPVEHICSGQIDILGRRVDVASSERRSSPHKEIVRLQLVDNNISVSVFQISSPTTSEYYFYNSIKELVRSGDISGVPLMVSGKEEAGRAQFVLPDYGYSIKEYQQTYGYDKSLLTLSMLATCCCLPATHMDPHGGNVCLYQHNIPFRYKWTLQTTTFVIELSWINNGLLTFIDWEHYNGAGTKTSSSTTSWVYKRDGWKLEIPPNSLGLPPISLFGEDGIWQILHYVLSEFPKERVNVKHVQNTPYEKNPVASLLEVFPEYPPADDSKPLVGIPDHFLNRWNQRMSDHGGTFKARTSLSARDLGCIKQLYMQILTQGSQVPHTLRSVCPIPSDTGLVCLKCDKNTLIANADIAADSIVTYLPTAKKIRLLSPEINPCIEVGVFSATVIRKIAPFVGFGGFTKWGSVEESNCTISVESPESKLRLFALRAVRSIIKGEEIVCMNTFLRHSVNSAAINHSFDELMEEVKSEVQRSRVNTRQRPAGQTVSTQQN